MGTVRGAPQPLTPASREFRQAVTLTGGAPFAFPDLSRVQPGLIGPVTDLLTFYADQFLAIHQGQLRQPGDRFFFPSPNGELVGGRYQGADRRRRDRLRRALRAPVADTPNNWVQVRRQGAACVASVGKETFDVELLVSLSGGEILSATLDNLVEAVARQCANADLTDCGSPRPDRTVRRIEMTLTGR